MGNDNLITLVENYKEGNTEQCFILIVARFEPLISKYVRKLFMDDEDDTRSELTLCLWEALNKIEYYNDEGQCIAYFYNAIRVKFLELYSKSRKHYDNQAELKEGWDIIIPFHQIEYDEINFKLSINQFIENYDQRNKQLLYDMLLNEKADTELSEIYGISRQYINRVRRKAYGFIKKALDI